SFIAGASTTLPATLSITRTGDVFTGSLSSDGTNWTTVGSVTLSVASAASAGLAVTSHDPSVLNTAVFDDVAAQPAPSAGDIVVYASDIPDYALHGAWMRATD